MSFRLKLVAYFLLVSLLPLGAAGWGLHAVAGRSETRRVDVRLEAGLRAVLAGYKDELSSTGRRAKRLGPSSKFTVLGSRGLLGTVLAGVPLNSSSLARLRASSGLSRSDLLVV